MFADKDFLKSAVSWSIKLKHFFGIFFASEIKVILELQTTGMTTTVISFTA